MAKFDKEKCKFLHVNKFCDHKENNDIRSKHQNGRYRRLSKRCDPKFCPLIKKEKEESGKS